jgi:hypothetical protein
MGGSPMGRGIPRLWPYSANKQERSDLVGPESLPLERIGATRPGRLEIRLV